MIGLQTSVRRQIGLIDYVQLVENAQADGISLPYQIVGIQDVRRLKQKNKLIQLWTPNTPKTLDELCAWPIDILISDYPEKASCFRKQVDFSHIVQTSQK